MSDDYSLPYPEPTFEGEIRPTLEGSTADFPQPREAPEGAPNVLLIMTDDVGFGAASTFGGPIPTPAFDRIAKLGIRYNRFHTTALCSPTRAALITGRNPHNASTGIVIERALGFPGYNSIISKSCGTVAEILRQHGYRTAWFGKNHNIPSWEQSAIGPFDRWPSGMGFEYFYGFIGGDCNQWCPPVWENTTPREPHLGNPDYHFDADLADQAIRWLQRRTALDPRSPFFAYYVPGATHAPHHVAEEWIAPFAGKFDHGWDVQRELTWKRQLERGLIPSTTKLTPRPENLPAWDACSADEKRLYTRMMEVYAGFLRFTDHNIGRVIEAVARSGELDNTLIIYIMGDNGGSGEGTLQGTANSLAVTGNGESEELEYLCSIQDELGGPMHYNHFPVAWSWALNSPFQWMKRYASHFGGTRNAMAMSWPKTIRDRGGLRSQFHHVIDIAPTILEAAGIGWPQSINGVSQKPVDGISMVPYWEPERRDDKESRKTQYFEMFCNRGLYHQDEDGSWLACTRPLLFAWVPGSDQGWTPEQFEWELYNLDHDYSQAEDLLTLEDDSKRDFYARKLATLKAMWWEQARQNQVLPLNASVSATVDAGSERPSLAAGRQHFEFASGVIRVPEGVAPDVKNTSFTITAKVEIPEEGAEGAIITQGGRFAGWGLIMLEGKPVWAYKRTRQPSEGIRVEATEPLQPGSHTIVVEFDYDYPGPEDEPLIGRGGIFRLLVDGELVSDPCSIDRTVPAAFSVDETLDVGEDTGTPIVEDYGARMPFAFSGTIHVVTIELPPVDGSHPRAAEIRRAINQAKLAADLANE